MPSSNKYGFNLLFMRRFFQIHKIIFPGFFNYNSYLFLLLLIMSLGEQYLVYRVGLISGAYYKVLGKKDLEAFKILTLKSIGIIISMTVIKSIRTFISRLLIVGWRKCLNLALHRLYFTGIRYYQLNVLDECSLDNPDQRLTADVSLMCTNYGNIITDIILAPFLISYYSYSAFSRSGWIGPVGMFIFFILSTALNKILMTPIVELTVDQEKREGDFRFKHVSVRTNAESLAFHDTARVEAIKVDNKLFQLCKVQQDVYKKQLFLELATNSFQYLGSIASFLVISFAIFGGVYDDLDPAALAQIISENAFVCMYLIYQFSKLVDMSGTVSSLAGATHRIMELAEEMSNLPKKIANNNQSQDDNDDDDDGEDDDNNFMPSPDSFQSESNSMESRLAYSINDITLYAPKGSAPLVKKLNLKIKIGENLLIMGKSSGGKSSILRSIRGLWSPQRGSIEKHVKNKNILFLPQKPFFTDGSLREQIIYPLLVAKEFIQHSENEWMVKNLEDLGLGDLLRRCNNSLDHNPQWSWYDVLSPGEMQRLAFVRLFYHKPVLAFLDEATSALSNDIENLLYQKCVELGITLVSVGHRENLKRYHSRILKIGLDFGTWNIEENNNAL